MKMKLTLLFFLVSLIVKLAEQSELICSHQPIMALAGDDVILPCHLEPPIDVRSETVVWIRPDLDPKYIHYHEDGGLNFQNQNPSYHTRTRLFVDELKNGNVSMKIFRVKRSDAGEYKCFLPSMQKEASIQLTVGESDVIGSHKPVKVTVGQDVILPCHLEPPFDVSTLTVEWTHDGKVVHLYRSGVNHLVGQDENYKDRTSLFHEEMTRGNISLKLTSVTELDEGSYTCYVPRLDSQVRRGKVILIVDPGDNGNNGSQSDALQDEKEIVTPAAGPELGTGGVIGILVIAGIVIGLFVWKRRRNSEENAGDGRRRQEDIALNDRGDNADN